MADLVAEQSLLRERFSESRRIKKFPPRERATECASVDETLLGPGQYRHDKIFSTKDRDEFTLLDS